MPVKDLRTFIQALEKSGNLVRINEEVDWDLEAGAIIRWTGQKSGPVPLFEKIKGYPPGYRILGRPIYNRKMIAIALGLDSVTSWPVLKKEVQRRLEHPIKPVIVSTGPCKENLLIGEDMDLLHFPVPMLNEGDGGRFLGTLDIVVVKDPDSDWINWGTYRMMVHDKKHTGMSIHQNQTGMLFQTKYKAKGKPMPAAAVIGADPCSHFVAAIKFGVGISEVNYAGALMQEPIELVKCETLDLLVPAHAEIVIEGELLPDVEMREAPFSEWTRHQSSFSWAPVFRARAITYRKDPIITTNSSSLSFDEVVMNGLMNEIQLERFLLERGIPVVNLHALEAMAGALVVVAVKRRGNANVAHQVAQAVHTYSGRGHPHMVMVVDEDVDVYNTLEVLHALAMRCHPARGIKVNDHAVADRLLPWLSPEEREWSRGATALFDCTWPPEWDIARDVPPRIFFRDFPQEVQQQALKVISKYYKI